MVRTRRLGKAVDRIKTEEDTNCKRENQNLQIQMRNLEEGEKVSLEVIQDLNEELGAVQKQKDDIARELDGYRCPRAS